VEVARILLTYTDDGKMHTEWSGPALGNSIFGIGLLGAATDAYKAWHKQQANKNNIITPDAEDVAAVVQSKR
jgi:hypothetical protein